MNIITATRYVKLIGAGAGLTLLAACANMANTPPGTPLAQVEAQFGRPNFSCPAENGGQRLIWIQKPNRQYEWGTNVDRTGNTTRIPPVLTEHHLPHNAPGGWKH